MNIEKPTFKHICLMYIQQLTNFPYIEKDFDAITDYQLLCKVVEYLNEVIANNNKQNEVVTNLYNAFIMLKEYIDNYFDNLDVQEEINNKLDEMAESGVLQEMLIAYLQTNGLLCFDTISDMKNSLDLIDGSYAKTLGYYSINDGGSAIYKITKDASLTEYQETLTSGLYATLIPSNELNPIMFGAYGDNTHDDTIKIQSAIDYAINTTGVLTGLNRNYIVSDSVVLPVEISSTEKGLYITGGLTFKNFNLKVKNYVTALTSAINIANPINTSVVIENVNINGNRLNQNEMTGAQDGGCHGLRIGFSSMESVGRVLVNNCHIYSCYSDNICVRPLDFQEMTIKNCIIEDGGRNGITDNSLNSLVENCRFNNNGSRTAPKSGYHIEPDLGCNFGTKTIKDCIIENTTINGIALYFNENTFNMNSFNIINCTFDKLSISGKCVLESHIKNINIMNCYSTSILGIVKSNDETNLVYDNINIINTRVDNRVRIAGNTGVLDETLTEIPNSTNVLIDGLTTNFDVILNYNFNEVKIINSKFIKDNQATVDEEAAVAILPSGAQREGYTYSINSLIIKNNYEKNYYRFIDNFTFGTIRQTKNITNTIIDSNVIEQNRGRIIRSYGINNKVIFNNNIVYFNADSISQPQFFFQGVDDLIGTNNMANFNTNRTFSTSDATRYIIANNLFLDTIIS